MIIRTILIVKILLSGLLAQDPYLKKLFEGRNYFNNSQCKTHIFGNGSNGQNWLPSNSRKTNYDLDLLMLTQGWSSYNWSDIFSNSNNIKYPFEQGINITANIKNQQKGTYFVNLLDTPHLEPFGHCGSTDPSVSGVSSETSPTVGIGRVSLETSAVPEASSSLLVGLGVIAFMARRRRTS